MTGTGFSVGRTEAGAGNPSESGLATGARFTGLTCVVRLGVTSSQSLLWLLAHVPPHELRYFLDLHSRSALLETLAARMFLAPVKGAR